MSGPVLMTVAANELQDGDYIHEQGIVWIFSAPDDVVVIINNEFRIIRQDERVVIHMEDDGKE